MGLEWECVRLQGLHSASPRYTPAYALTAPNGALPEINKIYWIMSIEYLYRAPITKIIDMMRLKRKQQGKMSYAALDRGNQV